MQAVNKSIISTILGELKRHLGEAFNVGEYFNDLGADLHAVEVAASKKKFKTPAGENNVGDSSLMDAATCVDERRVVVTYDVKSRHVKWTMKPSKVLQSPFTGLFGSVGRFVSASKNTKFFR